MMMMIIIIIIMIIIMIIIIIITDTCNATMFHSHLNQTQSLLYLFWQLQSLGSISKARWEWGMIVEKKALILQSQTH